MYAYIMEQISPSQKTKLTFCDRFDFGANEVQAIISRCLASRIGSKGVDTLTESYAQIMAKWAVETNKWGMLMCGTYGCGKTTLANAFADAYELIEGTIGTIAVIRLSAIDVCAIARTNEARFNEICNKVELIVIDDVGTEPVFVKVFGTDASPVVEMLYKRYDNRKPIIVTTNLAAKQFYARYGERIKDRGKEMFSVITMKNGSRR